MGQKSKVEHNVKQHYHSYKPEMIKAVMHFDIFDMISLIIIRNLDSLTGCSIMKHVKYLQYIVLYGVWVVPPELL